MTPTHRIVTHGVALERVRGHAAIGEKIAPPKTKAPAKRPAKKAPAKRRR